MKKVRIFIEWVAIGHRVCKKKIRRTRRLEVDRDSSKETGLSKKCTKRGPGGPKTHHIGLKHKMKPDMQLGLHQTKKETNSQKMETYGLKNVSKS